MFVLVVILGFTMVQTKCTLASSHVISHVNGALFTSYNNSLLFRVKSVSLLSLLSVYLKCPLSCILSCSRLLFTFLIKLQSHNNKGSRSQTHTRTCTHTHIGHLVTGMLVSTGLIASWSGVLEVQGASFYLLKADRLAFDRLS